MSQNLVPNKVIVTLMTLAVVSSFICNILYSARVGVEKRDPSYIVGKNVYWYSHDTEQYGGSLRN